MKVQKILFRWCLSFALLLSPWVANALAPQWKMIPEDSQLTFTGTQNGAPVTGAFKIFDATIFADLQTLKDSRVDIVVDINSIHFSYAEITKTLISADWFNAKLFPKAEFKATEFKKLSHDNYEAAGTLTIRDKSVPTMLIFTVKALSPNKAAVNGSTVIKRTNFGVGKGEWASTEDIKDEVTIKFNIIAVKK